MPVSMIVPLKVRRSTMAAQRRGSVKVLVQPPKDSLEAMATLFFPSRQRLLGLFEPGKARCPRTDIPPAPGQCNRA